MSSYTAPCGCQLTPATPSGVSASPCAAHQLDPAGLGDVIGAYNQAQPPANPPTGTYSGNPASSLADALRFKLGDTGQMPIVPKQKFLFTDGEIAYLLLENGNNVGAAAIAGCYNLIAKAAALRDESVGAVSISWNQVFQNYTSLLAQLRRSNLGRALPFAGGISKSQKRIERNDPDRVKPSFVRDLFQEPDDPEQPIGTYFDPTGDADGDYNA